MIPRIKELKPMENYCLSVLFDDGKKVIYDVKTDIEKIESYGILMTVPGLFSAVQLDESRTCIFWNDKIDLPSDAVYEYGTPV